jgi:hypothetical protein
MSGRLATEHCARHGAAHRDLSLEKLNAMNRE